MEILSVFLTPIMSFVNLLAVPILGGLAVCIAFAYFIEGSKGVTIGKVVGGIVGLILAYFVFTSSESDTMVDNVSNYLDNTEVVDRAQERRDEKNRTLDEKEALKAVLNKYTIGTVVKGYRLGEPTGYNAISSHQNYNERNKREFLVGFNLDNGRVGYLEGTVTKIDGEIKVSHDKIIIE